MAIAYINYGYMEPANKEYLAAVQLRPPGLAWRLYYVGLQFTRLNYVTILCDYGCLIAAM